MAEGRTRLGSMIYFERWKDCTGLVELECLHVEAGWAQQTLEGDAHRFFVIYDSNEGPGFTHEHEPYRIWGLADIGP